MDEGTLVREGDGDGFGVADDEGCALGLDDGIGAVVGAVVGAGEPDGLPCVGAGLPPCDDGEALGCVEFDGCVDGFAEAEGECDADGFVAWNMTSAYVLRSRQGDVGKPAPPTR